MGATSLTSCQANGAHGGHARCGSLEWQIYREEDVAAVAIEVYWKIDE